MSNKLTCIAIAMFLSLAAKAQMPEVTSWIINTTGATGYSGIPSNVQQVQYSDSFVYVSATCIPGYSIGPWQGNPNIPANKNFVYKMPRFPRAYSDTAVGVGLGHVGVWTNGVSVFNALDAQSYNNQGIWLRNAYFFEGSGFDSCLGHPAPGGEYHHHVSPWCLYNIYDSTHHSPIIGYSFDGYPIYGAYGYADTTGTGPIRRMKSGFQVRNITDRTTLPDGTILTPSQYGPAISTTYPLGAFQQDFELVPGGDLDEHNGRYCKTPEYPNGIYAYFVTIDAALNPAYPYTLGLTYFGNIPVGNTGPQGGHNTITDSVQTYTPTGVATIPTSKISVDVFPNPSSNFIHLFIDPVATNNFIVTLSDIAGKTVFTQKNVQPTILYSFDVSKLAPGAYVMAIKNTSVSYSQKITITR